MPDNNTVKPQIDEGLEVRPEVGKHGPEVGVDEKGLHIVANGHQIGVWEPGSRGCTPARPARQKRAQRQGRPPARSRHTAPHPLTGSDEDGYSMSVGAGNRVCRLRMLTDRPKMMRLFHLALLTIPCLIGCVSPPRPADDAATRQMLALLMPSRVEIVEPFTRVRSFDDDALPDGIELLLQAVNSLDNPGLMIAGRVRAELYEFLPASGDRKGRRLEHWSIELANADQQRRYWNTLTQMYEFRLGIDPTKIPAADKYVLLVTYSSPLGERLTDECLIHYQVAQRRAGLGPGNVR